MSSSDHRDYGHSFPSAGRLVATVAALNVLGFVDRQLMVALAPLLIVDFGLTRAQVGLLVGVSFIGVFAVGTLIAGVLADRWNRPRLMALGLAIWSLGTALTATASSFGALVFWRAVVGAGESALPVTALAMIADRVPERRVGLSNGVYYAGVPVGFALSFALSGALGPALGWRTCFVALGALGLLGLVPLLRLADPPRHGTRAPAGQAVGSLRAVLAERPLLVVLTAAGVLLVFASAASQHAITWLVAERGFEFARAAWLSAGVTLMAGLAGNMALGALSDRARRVHPAGRLLALSAASGVGLLAAAGFYTLPPASPSFFACWVAAQGFLLGWYGSLAAAVAERAPEGRRATVLGFLLLFVNLLGVASGPYVTGLISDRSSLTHGLLWSLVPGAAGAIVLGLAGLHECRASPRRQTAAADARARLAQPSREG